MPGSACDLREAAFVKYAAASVTCTRLRDEHVIASVLVLFIRNSKAAAWLVAALASVAGDGTLLDTNTHHGRVIASLRRRSAAAASHFRRASTAASPHARRRLSAT